VGQQTYPTNSSVYEHVNKEKTTRFYKLTPQQNYSVTNNSINEHWVTNISPEQIVQFKNTCRGNTVSESRTRDSRELRS
jgi:hypothetical protein